MELREQAVLMRASHDSDLLELELTRRRIPFVKYGGLRYLEAAHVKDLIAGALPGRRHAADRPRATGGGGTRLHDVGASRRELVLDPPQSSTDLAGPPHLDEDYLVLATIHSAKLDTRPH